MPPTGASAKVTAPFWLVVAVGRVGRDRTGNHYLTPTTGPLEPVTVQFTIPRGAACAHAVAAAKTRIPIRSENLAVFLFIPCTSPKEVERVLQIAGPYRRTLED